MPVHYCLKLCVSRIKIAQQVHTVDARTLLFEAICVSNKDQEPSQRQEYYITLFWHTFINETHTRPYLFISILNSQGYCLQY